MFSFLQSAQNHVNGTLV